MRILCPHCNTEFGSVMWADIQCPNCNKEGIWDERPVKDEDDNIVDYEIYIDWS